MRNKIIYLAIFLCIIPSLAYADKTLTLTDTSGKINLKVKVSKEDICYSVFHGGDEMISPSPISMTLTDGTTFGKNPKLKKVTRTSVDNVIYPPIYKKKSIRDNYNEMKLDFRGGYSLVFRAYEDGVAYRFISKQDAPFLVKEEQATFNLPTDQKVFVAIPKGREINGREDPFHSSFQNVYQHVNISQWTKDEQAFLPVLVEGKHDKKICITEADLLNYPGMFLQSSKTGNGFKGLFAAYPKELKITTRGLKEMVISRESYIAKVEGRTMFPWRVMVISENDAELLCNDMVYKLATPAPKADYSWIKPGKVAWDWWNDWNLYNVDFKAGINTETHKYYIDFASKYGIEYVILDEGWSVPGAADLMQVVPEIELKELISYARQKNVDLILWAGFRAFDLDMENVCKHYAAMGIKGFKIDFMDRDDQYMVDFNRRCAEVGLKYKLLIDLHGTYKPTGLQRTYPNAVNFEGVHGLEEMKWAKPGTDQVTYDVTMPFIRMVAGPLDYTQGAMGNANKENFKAVYSEPMSQGTRCRQLAEYVIFDSPINMLCDSPSKYLEEEECTKFIAGIPTVWDESFSLKGEVGKYIAMARQKDGVWYVGALTDWDARDMELDLSFLGEGKYQAEVFEDGVNAERVGKDYKRRTVSVPENKKITIHMAPGGGFIMKISRID